MAKRSKPEIVDVEALRAALTAAELRADQATSRADQATSRADQATSRADQARPRLADEAALRADEAQAAVERARGRGRRREGPTVGRCRADRPPPARDRQAHPHALRPALRADPTPPRPVRAATRGARSLGGRRRARGREGRRQSRGAGSDRTAQALAPALPGPVAARARRGAGPDRLPVLRGHAPVEDGRGRHRDAGGGAAPVDRDPDRARALLVPRLRERHPAAGARSTPSRAGGPARACSPWCCSRSTGSTCH